MQVFLYECGGDQELNPMSCTFGDTMLTLHYTPTNSVMLLDSNHPFCL